jgi:hypothetical protein
MRIVLVLTVTIAVALLGAGQARAGGAFFPSYPPDLGLTVLDTSANITATIALDPNGPESTGLPSTPTGPFGSIVITRPGIGTAAGTFQVEPGSSLGVLRFGCNLLRTNLRFVEFAPGFPGLAIGGPGGFANWLSTDVTTKLFGQLGITLVDASTSTTLRVPGIASVTSQQCASFPKVNKTLDFLMLGGLLGNIKPLPPVYPDRTIAGVTDPTQQWFPGFLILSVEIGLWRAPSTPAP